MNTIPLPPPFPRYRRVLNIHTSSTRGGWPRGRRRGVDCMSRMCRVLTSTVRACPGTTRSSISAGRERAHICAHVCICNTHTHVSGSVLSIYIHIHIYIYIYIHCMTAASSEPRRRPERAVGSQTLRFPLAAVCSARLPQASQDPASALPPSGLQPSVIRHTDAPAGGTAAGARSLSHTSRLVSPSSTPVQSPDFIALLFLDHPSLPRQRPATQPYHDRVESHRMQRARGSGSLRQMDHDGDVGRGKHRGEASFLSLLPHHLAGQHASRPAP